MVHPQNQQTVQNRKAKPIAPTNLFPRDNTLLSTLPFATSFFRFRTRCITSQLFRSLVYELQKSKPSGEDSWCGMTLPLHLHRLIAVLTTDSKEPSSE
jgi:hypothetical protein